MPSSFTADIYENLNTSVKDFVTRAAKGWGYFAHQRDAAMNAPLRVPEVPQYLFDLVDEAKKAFDVANARGDQHWELEFIKRTEELQARNAQSVKQHAERLAAYDAVRTHVLNLEFPEESFPDTPYSSFKHYLLKNLDESREFDCGHGPYITPLPLNAAKFKADTLAELASQFARAQEQLGKSIADTDIAAKWVSGLLDILGKVD